MASVKEILSIEDTSLQTIVLHHEGIFYKAYNQSAYLFHKFVRQYQVKAKYCKKEQQVMYSLGFPQSALADILKKVNQQDTEGYPKTITFDATKIEGFCQQSEQNYTEWTAQWSAENVKSLKAEGTSIVERILAFDLQNATPMECMNFINQLQTELRNGSAS